jgi:hypothetical protein
MKKPFSPYNVERHQIDDQEDLARELGPLTYPIPSASTPAAPTLAPTLPAESLPKRDPRLAVLSLTELELYYLKHWTDEQREFILSNPAKAMAWYRENGHQQVTDDYLPA